MRIGIDIMGGDFFPKSPIEGVILASQSLGDSCQLVLIGDKSVIEQELAKHNIAPNHYEIVHTDEVIEMEDNPTKAIARKTNSSINTGIQLAKEGHIDGFISAGNTGAMLVGSILGLRNIPGVLRPTIGVLFPNFSSKLSFICDVGANVDCKAEVLAQFGALSSIYYSNVHKVENPKVALINIGEEKTKGPQAVQAAYEKLEAMPDVNFIGNAEGRDIYTGLSDIYVCDGFTGNILLKFAESFYDVLKSKYAEGAFAETFNFENYGGVPVLGVNGVIIIGHGISTGPAIENMIKQAAEAINSGLTDKIRNAFELTR